MRVAFAGKGAGKTTIAATLARLAGRRGTPVVAIDADSNPNLAAALGVVPSAAAALAGIPAAAVSRKLTGPSLTAAVDDVLAAHGTVAPDGVRLLVMGALPTPARAASAPPTPPSAPCSPTSARHPTRSPWSTSRRRRSTSAVAPPASPTCSSS